MKKPVIFALFVLPLIPAVYCLLITLQSVPQLLQCENTLGICGETILAVKLMSGLGTLLWGLLSVNCYAFTVYVTRYLRYISYSITVVMGVIFITAFVTG